MAEDRERAERLTRSLGERLHKPVVSGSDTHQAVQYGCIWTEFAEKPATLDELRRQISAGAYQIMVSEQAAFQVKTADVYKRQFQGGGRFPVPGFRHRHPHGPLGRCPSRRDPRRPAVLHPEKVTLILKR